MAPQTIGTPDYVKRFGISGATLFSVTWSNDTDHVSAVIDSNGFPALILADRNFSTASQLLLTITWYLDAAGTIALQSTPWTPTIGGSVAAHFPVLSRYFTVSLTHLTVTDGTTSTINIYGTSLPYVNIANQNKYIALCLVNTTLAASAINTKSLLRSYPGEVMVNIDDNVNNKWTAWLEYWDASSLSWQQFWSAHGIDKGQGWTERIILPAAPVRTNIRNDDTVSHGFILCVMGL